MYDILKFYRCSLYTGLSAGLGYLTRPSGYDELGDESPFGMIDARLGACYEILKKYFMRAQVGISHISSIVQSDQGHNNWDFSMQFGCYF